jgi:hypothetical protein
MLHYKQNIVRCQAKVPFRCLPSQDSLHKTAPTRQDVSRYKGFG